MRSLITVAAIAALTAGVSAQATPNQLSAGFNGTFFTGAADATCYFDLDVTNAAGITLFNINHNLNGGAANTASIRVASGPGITFLNNETDPLFWPVDPDAVSQLQSAGAFNPTPGAIPGGLFLPQGQHAIAITYSDGLPIFTPNPGTNGAVSDANLAFSGGSVGAPFLGAPFNAAGAFIFNGDFDYFIGNVAVASAVPFGTECPAFNDASLVLEQFNPAGGAPSDLTGSEIVLSPNGTGGYSISGTNTGSNFVAPSGSAQILALGDDTLSGPIMLTNSVTGPDGNAVNMVEVDSNGRVLFDTTANTATIGGPFPADFQNSVANVQIGADYDPSVGGTVTVEEIGTDVVFTWDAVPEFGQPTTMTTQIVLQVDGTIRFRFETFFPVAISNVGCAQGIGFSDFAGPLTIADVTDLSDTVNTPVDTGANSIGVTTIPLSSPTLGGSLDIQLGQVPPTSIGTFLLLGFANPALDLTPFGAVGCVLVSTGEATLPVIDPSVPVVTPIPGGMALAGVTLFVQAAALDPFAGNPFFISLGNGVEATIQAQ